MLKQYKKIIFLLSFIFVSQIMANINAGNLIKTKTKSAVTAKLKPLIDQYCGQACQLIDVKVFIEESLPENIDLGFESLGDDQRANEYHVEQVEINIQVEHTVSRTNRDKLQQILKNHLNNFSPMLSINLLPVDLPYIGQTSSLAQLLRNKIQSKIEKASHKTIQRYCPHECILSDVSVLGRLITPDEAEGLDSRELVHSNKDPSVLQIDRVNIFITFDENFDENERANLLSVLKAETAFVMPVSIQASTTIFPESYSKRKARVEKESNDPYGLEKLRRTLILFRDLASTKEIISNSESSENNSSSSKNDSLSNNSSDSWTQNQWIIFSVSILVFIIIIGLFAIRISRSQKDANMMIHAINEEKEKRQKAKDEGPNKRVSNENHAIELKKRLLLEELKEDLIQIFVSLPKVAKTTFSRLLQEEGVEETAKYVSIFGKLIIFELLSDPGLQRNLYELSEYYHSTMLNFTLDEEIELLQKLKTKVTANEIKVLAENTIDQFDFLLKLDSPQIYTLMIDENPQIQSIILTQLSQKKRRIVFEMFSGDAKVKLMQELCQADAIPREFLFNVAKALAKKVLSKPELDTQSLRSSDIILELLEKATLSEQKNLMKNLIQNNAEAARLIKMSLVSIETLPYLKDGHLLELVLGMEREDLLNFLGGAPEHISSLLLSHAPEELAESWRDDLEMQAAVEDGNYRLVELKVLNKVRQLASNGVISLLEINEMIFANLKNDDDTGDKNGDIDSRNLVA